MLKPREHNCFALPTAQIREIENTAFERIPSYDLMTQAGRSSADFANTLIEHRLLNTPRAAILVGPGNNGGDGLVMGMELIEHGWEVDVYEIAMDKPRQGDSVIAMDHWKSAGNEILPLALFVNDDERQPCDLIVDALFGIGWKTSIELPDEVQQVIRHCNLQTNSHHTHILALDVPTGLNADTGQASRVCMKATHTITFIAAKPGLFTANAADYCGQVHIATLGLDSLVQSVAIESSHTALLKSDYCLCHLLPLRPNNSHKGTFGDLLIIGGAQSMAGAALLSARSAIHSGSGRVYLSLLDEESHCSFDPLNPEIMIRPLTRRPEHITAVVLGPGMGESEQALSLLEEYLHTTLPLVIDADALNLIAKHKGCQQLLQNRSTTNAQTILTPHPLEAARLLDHHPEYGAADVQNNRIECAKQLAQQFGAVVVLKGAGSIIVEPDSLEACINLSGGRALATAGSGDVLAGLIGALLAQKLTAYEAAQLGVWLHGKSAEAIPGETQAPTVLHAGAFIPRIQTLLNQLY